MKQLSSRPHSTQKKGEKNCKSITIELEKLAQSGCIPGVQLRNVTSERKSLEQKVDF